MSQTLPESIVTLKYRVAGRKLLKTNVNSEDVYTNLQIIRLSQHALQVMVTRAIQ